MSSGNELSFLPDGYLARKSRRRAVVIGSSMVFVVAATVAFVALRVQRSLGELEAQDASVTKSYARAARAFEPQTRNRDQQRRIIERASLAAGLIENIPRSNIVAELTNALPAGGSLLEVSLDTVPRTDVAASSSSTFDMHKATQDAKHQAEQLPVPTAPNNDVSVHLTGLAESDREVAQYLASLGASALFKDVNLVISEAFQPNGQKQSSLRRFQIQLSLKGDGQIELPVRSVATTTADLVD